MLGSGWTVVGHEGQKCPADCMEWGVVPPYDLTHKEIGQS
jgi:hypothetical protein